MKILLVEDEIRTLQHISSAITRLFPSWEIVGKAKNGKEGIELALTHLPDLIITDIKMPVMDGLMMIRHLIQSNCSAKFMILSGYSDFQYAREALKLGSVDYILKPFTLDSFKQAMESAEAGILQENEMKSSLPSSFSLQKLFTLILTLQDTAREPYLKEYSRRINNNFCSYLLLLKADHSIPKEQLNILYDIISAECLQQKIKEAPHFSNKIEQDILVFFHIPPFSSISVIIERIRQKISKTISLPFAFYVTPIHQIEELTLAVEHMRKQIYWNLSFSEPCVLTDKYISEKNYFSYHYDITLEKKICSCIASQNIAAAADSFEIFCSSFSKRLYTHSDIRTSIFRLTEAILFTIRSENYSIFESLDYLKIMDWSKKIMFLSSYMDIMYSVFQQLECFQKKLNTCNNPIVNKALGIIISDYAQNISLESVADRCNVTYEYLSSLFTKELGVKFTAWLTQYRISQAKKLLTEKSIKISEVSAQCGYEDVHYFCKVFKKQVGMSPTDYIRYINH
nr:AraC family transcriptional regulator [uncultured Blautia sp.]